MKALSPPLAVFCLILTASAETVTVLNTNDSGAGSFREALVEANRAASVDTIAFDIPGTGRRVIQLLSALPPVTRPITIDGFTQPGAKANDVADGNNAVWLIELDGTRAGANRDGLELLNSATVRGLRISGFRAYGIDISGDNSVVAGCCILSNGLGGVRLDEAEQTLIGGRSPAERNVISGNNGAGVFLDDHGMFNRILGNFIGTDLAGTGSHGNGGWGVSIGGPLRDNIIGGTNSGEANLIAFNRSGGVRVEFGLAWNNSIRGNRIFSNGGLGIDLDLLPGVSGVTTNDLGDVDEFGANHLQNFPLLTNTVTQSATTTVQGWLNSQAHTEYALDFYGNTGCGASGYGEGEFYLGSLSVTTDANGNASFEMMVAATPGRYLTVTATDPLGNTSEFSPCWPKPVRIEFAQAGGAHALLLRNVDGSPISSEQFSTLRVLAATNLSPQSVWLPVPHVLELTDGLVRVHGLEPTNSFLFFRGSSN